MDMIKLNVMDHGDVTVSIRVRVKSVYGSQLAQPRYLGFVHATVYGQATTSLNKY